MMLVLLGQNLHTLSECQKGRVVKLPISTFHSTVVRAKTLDGWF